MICLRLEIDPLSGDIVCASETEAAILHATLDNTGIGLMYIYVIFLTMPSLFRKKDDNERKRIHFLTLLCVKNVVLWFMFGLEVHH